MQVPRPRQPSCHLSQSLPAWPLHAGCQLYLSLGSRSVFDKLPTPPVMVVHDRPRDGELARSSGGPFDVIPTHCCMPAGVTRCNSVFRYCLATTTLGVDREKTLSVEQPDLGLRCATLGRGSPACCGSCRSRAQSQTRAAIPRRPPPAAVPPHPPGSARGCCCAAPSRALHTAHAHEPRSASSYWD
jgi:hypothetical protein